MSSLPDALEEIAHALKQYDRELDRAAAAAAIAHDYELAALRRPESMQAFRLRMANLHRQMEARHHACARLHRLHIDRLLRWRAGGAVAQRPVFMTAVADRLSVDSAAVVLFDGQRHELLAAVSDETARAAHDAEAVIGDGPALDIAAGSDPVVVTGAEVRSRWPVFGPAIGELGIRHVIAVPLRAESRRLGALCGYSHRVGQGAGTLTTAGEVADALTNTILPTEQVGDPDNPTLHGIIFDDADYPSAVNQAMGLLAARRGCDLDEALTLMRARAFAEGVSLPRIAARLLEGGDLG